MNKKFFCIKNLIITFGISTICLMPFLTSCGENKLSYVNFNGAYYIDYNGMGKTRYAKENANYSAVSYWKNPNATLSYDDLTDTNQQGLRYTYNSWLTDGSDDEIYCKNPYDIQITTALNNWIDPVNKYTLTGNLCIIHDNNEKKSLNTIMAEHPINATKIANSNIQDAISTLHGLQYQQGVVSNVILSSSQSDIINAFYNSYSNVYSEYSYVSLDEVFKSDNENIWKQVSSIVFNVDQAAFLTGIAIGQYLNENYDIYSSNGLNLGVYGGMNINPVNSYIAGFQNGIRFFNDVIEGNWNKYSLWMKQKIIKSDYWKNIDPNKDDDMYKHKINFISLGKNHSSWYSNGFSSSKRSKEIVKKLLKNNADVIIPVAGSQYADAVNEIYNSKSNAIVVGVDSPIELLDNQNKKWNINNYYDKNDNNDIIKFSCVKNIPNILDHVLDIQSQANTIGYVYGDQPDQYNPVNALDATSAQHLAFGGEGFINVGNLNNKGVKPSYSSYKYIVDFLCAGRTKEDNAPYEEAYFNNLINEEDLYTPYDYNIIKSQFLSFKWPGKGQVTINQLSSDDDNGGMSFFYI